MASRWTPTRLGDLIEIRHGYAFQGRYFHSEPPGDVLLTPGNFAIGGGFQAGKLKFYRGPVPAEYVLREDDLIVTMTDLSKTTDTLGYPARVPRSEVGRRYLHNQRLGKIQVIDEAAVDGRFIYYLMCTDEYRDEVLASATGTTVRHTSPGRIRGFSFELPPVSEQRRIAGILGAFDDKVALSGKMNATLEAMMRALFKWWFRDYGPALASVRDPDGWMAEAAAHFGDGLEDDGDGHRFPTGWEPGSIADLAARVIERVPSLDEWANEPLIDLSRMPEGSVALGEWGRGDELSTSVTRFSRRDILFGAIRPYFHKVGVAPLDGVTNTSVFVIRPHRQEDTAFVAALCSDASVVDYAVRVAKGTKMPVVGWKDFAQYGLPLPPPSLRSTFGEFVQPLLDRIALNLHETKTLERIKRTLLPALIRGEIESAPSGLAAEADHVG